MRRPEIEGFISIAAMANRYDFSFLAPCPSSGLFVHGSEDRVAPVRDVVSVIEKVKTQKGVKIEHAVVEGANHFFDGKVDELMDVGRRLSDEAPRRRRGRRPERRTGAPQAARIRSQSRARASAVADPSRALRNGSGCRHAGEAATDAGSRHPEPTRDAMTAPRSEFLQVLDRARLHPPGLRCRGHRRGGRRGAAHRLCRLRLHRPLAPYRPPAHDHDAALAAGDRRRPADRAHGRRHHAGRRPLRQGREPPDPAHVEQIEANKDEHQDRLRALPRASATARRDAIMVDNAEWLTKLNYIEFLRDVGRHFSVNRMLSFDSVKLRLEREQELSFLEFNYMILQAYDFVELNRRYGCVLQMGGSDQWGNIVNGIDLGRRMGTAAALRADLPAAHHRLRRQDGQDRRRRRLAQRRPDAALRFLAVLAQHRGRRRRPLPQALHDAAARRDRAARSAGRRRDQRGQEDPRDRGDRPPPRPRGRRGGGRDGAQDLRGGRARRDAADGRGHDRRCSRPGLGVLTAFGPEYARLVPSTGEARRQVKSGGLRVNDAAVTDERGVLRTADLTPEGVIKLSFGKKRHVLLRAV